MNTNPTNELFRLSAILYADNNYEVSPKTTHRKIIESALIENGNQFITIPNLCIYINATYELVFSEDEINDIIKSPKNSRFECCRFNSFYTCRNLDRSQCRTIRESAIIRITSDSFQLRTFLKGYCR